MSEQSLQNPFLGINPLLHEILLTQGRWVAFHNVFLSECFKTLSAQLRGSEYKVELEETLHIHPIGQDIIRYRPDLYIAKTGDAAQPALQTYTHETVALADILTLDDDEPAPLALVIHKGDGEPVTWIEVLSPSNKLPNYGYYPYVGKRKMVLSMGIVFIELDFIHTHAPTFRYANYAQHQDGASPFHITTLIPNPTIEEGVAHVLHFGIMTKIPMLTIPLLGNDKIVFDLDAIYQQLFVDADYVSRINITASELTTYHPDDHQKIVTYLSKS